MAVNGHRVADQSEKAWYVYALVRPDTDEIFYIGKGCVWGSGKDHIDTHEEEARRGNKLKKNTSFNPIDLSISRDYYIIMPN